MWPKLTQFTSIMFVLSLQLLVGHTLLFAVLKLFSSQFKTWVTIIMPYSCVTVVDQEILPVRTAL